MKTFVLSYLACGLAIIVSPIVLALVCLALVLSALAFWAVTVTACGLAVGYAVDACVRYGVLAWRWMDATSCRFWAVIVEARQRAAYPSFRRERSALAFVGMPIATPTLALEESYWCEPSFESLGVPSASEATPEPLPAVCPANHTVLSAPCVACEVATPECEVVLCQRCGTDVTYSPCVLSGWAVLCVPCDTATGTPPVSPEPVAPAIAPTVAPSAPAIAYATPEPFAAAPDYAAMGVRELRKLASARGVRHTGLKKADLVAALEALPASRTAA